jgi:hypothetical protein
MLMVRGLGDRFAVRRSFFYKFKMKFCWYG